MSTVLFDPIKAQAKVTDSVLVGFSGGKESIVTLDMCFRYFDNVKPYFMYMIPDLSFVEKQIEWYEKKYQTEIMRVPHPDLSMWMRYGVFRIPDLSYPIISHNDIYQYVRSETGIWWIAGGERINDSIVRRAMMKKSGSIDDKRGRFFPVSAWKKKEILEYIKYHNLRTDRFSQIAGFSFRSLQAEELKILRDNFPEDYEKVLRLFPFAAGNVKRLEAYGGKE